MVDETVINEVRELYTQKKVAEKPENALKISELVKQLSSENEELTEELEDLDEIILQVVISEPDFKYWVKFGEGNFEYGEGEVEDPSFVMSGTQATMGGMLAGEIDSTSAYMSGDLTVEGNLQDAIAYGEYLGLAMEIFRDMTG